MFLFLKFKKKYEIIKSCHKFSQVVTCFDKFSQVFKSCQKMAVEHNVSLKATNQQTLPPIDLQGR